MATVNSADYSIATNGDIRYTGTTTNNTVIEFHRWLGDLMDDALAAGNDLLDITDATASERSTDNIITLKAPYNIDDTVAQHLYDGSIIQKGGDEIYEGLLVFATAGTPLQILQDGKPAYPNFWGTGINADAANGISHRFMLKVRTSAADIDGRRLVGQTRAVGFTYSEFRINGTARGNNVLALTYATDLNNATAEATIRGWTTITNVEGYQLLDVNNDAVNEPYYSQWNTDKPTRTINDFYERHKWLHRESTIESSCADSGSDFQVANATIIGQSQSFANGVNAQYLTRVRARMKKTGSPTGNLTAKLYAHSGTFGTSSIPTGAALATSVNFDVATLTTAYVEYEIAFTTQFEMLASTNYTIALEHAVIDGSNFVSIQGLATTGTHAGNRAQLVSSTWTPTAGDDLYFKVYASPKQYGLPGEVFRGITHEIPVGLAAQSATDFSAVESVSWSGGTGRMFAIDDVNAARRMWIQLLTGVAPSAALVITGGTSGATATTNANTIAITSLSGSGSVITIGFGAQAVTPYPAGTTFTVAGCVPTAYNGTYVSTGGSTTTATAAGTATGSTSFGTIVGVVVERTLSQPAVGASTGSAIIGSYGLGIETLDLTASDKLTDLNGVLRIPPNNVTFTVSGLVSGEDRVLVAPLGREFAWDTEGGTPPFVRGETLTFTSPAGTAYLSALRDDGTSGRMQVRMLTGSVPTDNSTIAGGTSGATALVNGAVVASEDPRQLKLLTTLSAAAETAVVCTASIPTDTPSTGTIRVQANSGIFRILPYSSYTSATFTLALPDTGADEDIDVVASAGTFTRATGSFITEGFVVGHRISTSGFTNGGNNTTKTIASVTATVITVTDVSGLVDESAGGGNERVLATGADFSADNATGGAAEAGNSIFISYIDKLATDTSATFTGVYLADRLLFIRVRDGASTPIKTFETTGTLGSAGGSSTAIRTSDL